MGVSGAAAQARAGASFGCALGTKADTVASDARATSKRDAITMDVVHARDLVTPDSDTWGEATCY